MSDAPRRDTPAGGSVKPSRSPVEKMVVWGGILLLLAVVGVEAFAKYSYTTISEKLNSQLSQGDANNKNEHLTDADVKRIMGGKEPEFSGKISQLKIPARSYEIYVWRGLLKRNWNPPVPREDIDIHAAYSGQIRPDLLPEHIVRLRNTESREAPTFFSAYVLYVYYSFEDPKTKVREVVSLRDSREPFLYEESVEPYVYRVNLPNDEGLKQRHDGNMATTKAAIEKSGKKATQEALDELDPWKHPPAEYLKGKSSNSPTAR